MLRNPITQKRYSLNQAITSVPAKHFNSVVRDVAHVMGLVNISNVLGYRKGIRQPTLSQAKLVEEYFLNEWGITDVWKEIDAPLVFRKRDKTEIVDGRLVANPIK